MALEDVTDSVAAVAIEDAEAAKAKKAAENKKKRERQKAKKAADKKEDTSELGRWHKGKLPGGLAERREA